MGKGKTRKRKNGNGKAEKRVKGGKAEKRVKGGKAEKRVKGGKAVTHVLHILAMHWEKNLLKKRAVLTEYLIYVNQRFVFF